MEPNFYTIIVFVVTMVQITTSSIALDRSVPPAASSYHSHALLSDIAMADDLGSGDVQYNNRNACTPNLNKMVQSPTTILLVATEILQWWSSVFTY